MADELMAPMRLRPPSGGGNSELFDAMNMFSNSLQGFAKQVAVNRATSQVQDIQNQYQNQQMSEQEYRKQLGQVALGVTGQLTGMGMPASDVNAFVGQFKPKDFQNIQNPFEGSIAGITDPAKIRQASKDYIDAQSGAKLEQIRAKNELRLQSRQAELDANGGIDNKTMNALSNLRKQIDPSTASSRSLYGRLGQTQSKLAEVTNGLLHGDPAALTNFNLAETAQAMSSIFGGGVSTVSGTHQLMPPALNADIAKGVGYLNSTMEPANSPGVGREFQKITQRLQPIVDAQIRSNQKKTLRSELGIAGKAPNQFSAMAEGMIQNPDGTPETARIVNGRLRFASDDKIDELQNTAKQILATPNDPYAQQALEAIKVDPYYTQAMMERPQFQQIMKQAVERATGRDAYKGEPLPLKDEKK